MKKFVLFLSVIATSLVLVGCTCQSQPQPAPEPVAAPVHHDYKGEVSK